MILHKDISDRELASFFKNKTIALAGNKKLKIYGTLTCKSGKRMKMENRVFFESEYDAVELGYRPCGHCLKLQYKKWLFDKFT
jgi:methylphosphotriester-DNA--protein-cysteine methyltransferase